MTPTRAAILALINDPDWPYFTATVTAMRQGAAGEKSAIEVLNTLRWHEKNRRQHEQRPDDNHNGQNN